MSDPQRADGETNADYAARIREEAKNVPTRGWGAAEEVRRLLDRADRVERGEED